MQETNRDIGGVETVAESDLIDDPRENDDIFETPISGDVYQQNYRYGTDRRVPDSWYRNARALASIEDNEDEWTKKFYELLSGKGLGLGAFPFTPGGRIFANAGTGLKRASLINCLAGETKVLTRTQGRQPIRELAGDTHQLLTEGGEWVEAPIRSFGTQKLRKITLSRNGQTKTIFATPNHEWIVTTKGREGYQRVTTDELEDYHRIKQVRSSLIEQASVDQTATARGFTYGDGSVSGRTHADLVGEKAELRSVFDDRFGSPNSYEIEGNDVLRYSGMPESWSEDPVSLDSDPDTLLGWAAGYFAADGCVSEAGEVIMDSCSRENTERFIEVMEILGVGHYGLKTQDRISNLTGEPSTRYYVRLDPRDLSADFFLRSKHKQRYLAEGDRSLNYHWTVESVETTNRTEIVYCAQVEDTHSFVLHNGILTSNCFVSGFRGEDQDSMGEIQAELTRQAKILASEGGYGFCASVMRPRGSRIGGVGSMTPGAVQMLDMWNKQAATIVAGSGIESDRDDVKDKIRKGAQMVTMHVWHPDILEYITAKQEAGRLHKFNMSILVTDAFMEAVKRDEEWALRFPDFEGETEFYEKHWDGDLEAYQEKGGTVKVWRDPATGEKAVYRAREIWDKIMDSTYNRNEPGVLFIDTINRENNLGYCEHIDATNPCGEQVLPIGGVCLLGNLNLTQLVRPEDNTFRYDLLEKLVPRAVRFLDNVNDLTYVPTEKQRWNLQNKRRIGLGHFGDGSALMMMKKRYGSDDAVQTMRDFQMNLANLAYQASAKLAKEKEPFPLFDRDYYLNEAPFIQRLSHETREMIAEYGLRNSHLLSIQPTGNTSTLANAPSSGIEPVFMTSYIRTAEQPALPDGIDYPKSTDVGAGDRVGSDEGPDPTMWRAEEQGDEIVLRCEEDGYTEWQIHPTRGICKDELVEDYAKRHLEEQGEWDEDADWAVTTRELDVDDHLAQMKALAPYVDSAMSKTVNVPADYPYEDFKSLYKKAHETGVIKGVTTYRAGTMSAVLSSADDDDGDGVPQTEAPDRPETIDCAIHRIRHRGDNWKLLVGFIDEDPYEVFAFTTDGEIRFVDSEGDRLEEGRIRKAGSGHYQLLAPEGDDKVIVDDITSKSPDENVRHETRMISTALRHGAELLFVVKQLEKAEGSIASFGHSAAKALKCHLKEHKPTCDKCGSDNVRLVEGCMTCADCGHSRCS